MKPISLKVENFFSYKEGAFDFRSTGLVLLAGQYGAGKSAIPEAMFFALTGDLLRRVPPARAIRRRGDRARVSFVFEVEGVRYKVERSLVRNKGGASSKLSLFLAKGKGWAGVEASTKADLEEKLQALVGFSALVLRTAVFFTKRFQFVGLSDAEKKQILDDLIPEMASLQVGAQNTRLAQSGAEERRREVVMARVQLETRRGDLQVDLSDLEARSARAEAEYQAGVKRAVAELERAREERVESEKQPHAIDSDDQVKIGKAESRLEELCRELAVCVGNQEMFREELRRLDHKMAPKLRRQGLLKLAWDSTSMGVRCYACGRAMERELGPTRRVRLHGILQRVGARLTVLGEARERVLARLQVDGVLQQDLDRQRQAQGLAIERLQGAVNARVEWRLRMRATLDAAVARAEEALEAARARVDPYQEGVQLKRAQVEEMDGLLVEVRRQERRVVRELAYLEFCGKAFGNQGLRSFLLDTIMPVLTQEASRNARALSGDRIDLKFVTQTALASGELREKLDLEVTNLEGAESYAGSSFGEQARIDLSVALALHRVAEHRAGRRIGVLVLDELLDQVDGAGADAALDLVRGFARDRLVLAISHRPEFRSKVSRVVRVRKVSGISEVVHANQDVEESRAEDRADAWDGEDASVGA